MTLKLSSKHRDKKINFPKVDIKRVELRSSPGNTREQKTV